MTREVTPMPASSRAPLNSPESVMLRWMFKPFLLGLFLGGAAATDALAGR